jgi:hypothetical protein
MIRTTASSRNSGDHGFDPHDIQRAAQIVGKRG